MKSIKFLAALAIPAMFAACTNEEMIAVQSEVQQGKEFIGAELVSSGISMNFGAGVESRLYGSTWSDDDKLGLGWIVTENYSVAQSSESAPTEEELFGNHMFYKAEDGSFTSKGNIYKGWHFAYFPFTYMEELGKQKTVAINPVQKEDWDTDRYNTGLYLSARKFLSKNDLDENSQLKEKNFNMVRANNTIGVTIKPSTTFTDSEVLQKLAVKSITLETGTGVFDKKVNVNPTKLPEFQYDEDGVYDEAATIEAVKKSLSQVLTGTAPKLKSTTTEVESTAINLSGDQTLRIHTLASKAVNLDATKVKFTIKVVGGTFKVGYTSDKDASAAELNNNATIKTLVAAYKTGGAMTTPGGVLFEKAGQPFNLQLTADMFEPDFTEIQSEEEWNTAVLVADALDMTETEFIIAKNKDGENWEFTDVDGDGNLINLPQAALTVSGEKMILGAEGEWPAEGLTVETEVEVNENLTVADDVVMEATKIINNATIKAGKKSMIKSVENNKRIEVVYGSYVEVETDKEGTIAYEVLKSGETPARVNTLINGGNNGKYARVNTLVINKGVTFDLMMSTTASSEEDPYYNGVTTTNVVTDLKDISIEMNGGTIKGEKELTKSVKEIKVISGTNTVKDINVVTYLSVEEGAKVTIDATDHYHGLNLVKHDVIVGGDLSNKGQVTATTNVRVKNIDNEEGKTVVNSGYTVWYSNAYIQGGIAQGNILKTDNVTEIVTIPASANVEELKSSLVGAAEGSKVYLPANAEFDFSGAQYNFGGDTKASEVVSIIGKENTVIKGNTAKVFYFTLSDKSKDLILKDLTIENGYTGTSGNPATIWIRPDGCSENSIVNIVLENVNCTSVMLEAAYVDGITYNVTFKNCNIEKVDAHAFKNNDWTTYNNVTVEGGNVNVVKGGSAPENVTVTEK